MHQVIQHHVIRLPEVIKRTGLGRTTIYKKLAEKSFPAQFRLGPKAVGWLEADIQKWIEDRIAGSQTNFNR